MTPEPECASPRWPVDEAVERAARALLNAALAAEADSQHEVGGHEPLTALRARGLTASEAVRPFEARLVREALAAAGGNVSRAARLLGMKRTTLVARLRRAQRNLQHQTDVQDAVARLATEGERRGHG